MDYILTINHDETMVQNPSEGVWKLIDNGLVRCTTKTRAELIEYAHTLELQKIRRMKALEQLYSRYQGAYLWSAKS